MDGRRPRIKPAVNLQPKRKSDITKAQPQPKSLSASASVSVSASLSSTVTTSSSTIQASLDLKHPDQNVSTQLNTSVNPQSSCSTQSVRSTLKVEEDCTTKLEHSPFKKPSDVKTSSSEILNSSTTFISSVSFEGQQLEQPQQQQQQQQQQNVINATSISSNTSPQQSLKHRQRIKPTPYFGATRRSSIQGNSIQDVEEEHHRRQRNISEQSAHQTSVNTNLDKSETNEKYGGDSNTNENGNNIANIPGTVTAGTNTNRNQISSSRYRKISSSEDAFQKSSFTSANKRSSMKYNNSKPIEKSAMKMLDFIYYNPSTNPMNLEADKSEQIQVKSNTEEPSANNQEENKPKTNTVTEATASVPAAPVPQLKLGPNGEVILDEQSLVIETTAEKEGKRNLLKSGILYLDDNTGNNGFYKRHKRTKEWSSEETIKFYRCLHTVGTDFSLMLTLFPNRTRRDLKLKFKKEEKTNLGLVNKALLYPKAFNVDELRKELEKDERDTVEKSKKWKDRQTKKVVKHVKNTVRNKTVRNKESKASRTLFGGEIVYETDRLLHNDSNTNAKKISQKNLKDTKNINKIEKNVIKGQEDEDEDDEEEGMKNDNGDVDEQFFFDMLLKEEQDNINPNDTTDQEELMLNQKTSDISADDIDEILTRLSNGSLVLVSSEDSNNPGKSINEIYIMCKETGQLSNKPLDLPEDVVNCIASELYS